ncbi:uncharacterized protein TM35_000431080 [Trypanosoma theileri]|uniref:Mucin TcMUCII n=1 Tax=Trypanosoma theileri TaxID=67003 RepID=A0A1X0NKA8_9TRYP|nr:uncharacterized protein TM35_000431080 [Trypanosoma theileri]ORC84540.1 hypothetical protein TM35_000431080 [Trypanosoma theileri]
MVMMMRYVLCILALLLSCACVYVLAEEVPAADLSDQVPDTDSETKCTQGTSRTSDAPECKEAKVKPETTLGPKPDASSAPGGGGAHAGNVEQSTSANGRSPQGTKGEAECSAGAVGDNENCRTTTTSESSAPGHGSSGSGESQPTQVTAQRTETVSDVQDPPGPPGESGTAVDDTTGRDAAADPSPGPTSESPTTGEIGGASSASEGHAGGSEGNANGTAEQPSTNGLTTTGGGENSSAATNENDPSSAGTANSGDETTTNNEESTSISTTTTTTLPPELTNNKKGDADSSSSINSSVWVRVPLLIVVTLACILVC